MPSSYSNNLKIELIATGEQDGTWGNTTNTNLGTALEQAIVGRAVVTFATDADLTLTLTTSNAAQDARAVYLVADGTISASRNLIVPTIFKNYVVKNSTTGGQNIVVKTSAGTGVTVPNGKTVAVYVDGTNVIKEIDYIESLALGGTPTAPTAAPGTNTTQIATTAFTAAAVTAATGSLGTMSTQNANNVAITGGSISTSSATITGGSISGITPLPVASGGTGTNDGGSLVPAGTVLYVARNSAPTGYLKANGAAISRSTYAALFSAIGTTFGAGDGSTTFNLPDMRGEFPRGWDDGRGVDSGRAFGSAQSFAMQPIQGSIDNVQKQGVQPFVVTGPFTTGASNANGNTTAGSPSRVINFDSSLVTQTAAETRPRNIALLACIKF